MSMKIEIMGDSGSGKSTLCRNLSEKYNIPALHLDAVHFLPDWKVRETSETQSLVTSFPDNNPKGWIIDGNYTKLSYDRRAVGEFFLPYSSDNLCLANRE